VVVGDSHVAVFEGWKPDGFRFSPTVVYGATASGIRNPNSKTEALPRFRERFARLRSHQEVLIQLGEVDCGYIIWRRAEREGLEPEEQVDETIARYLEFLEDVRATGVASVSVMSVPLPTLPDEADGWGEIAQRRADVGATQQQRTELTLLFNARMAEQAREAGFGFVDATSGQLNRHTRLIDDRFLRHGEADHHLRDEPYRELIARALREPKRPTVGQPDDSSAEAHPHRHAADWAADRALYPPGRHAWITEPALWAVATYRFGRWANTAAGLRGKFARKLHVGLHLLMRITVGVELPVSAQVGPGLRIFHQSAITISGQTKIGARCRLRQGVTIGVASTGGGSPVLGDDVFVGPYAQILGAIEIGDGAVIGAMAVVTRDVPAGARVRAAPTTIDHR
jgi:serine O-acetyltransferase